MTRPTCPACAFEASLVQGITSPKWSWCAGVGAALAAQHRNDVRFPFSLCARCAEMVRTEMNEALKETDR